MNLQAEDLSFAYERRPVVDGVSLAVREGELVGVIGPNGAGKSTLLACLHGALRPRSGAVRLDGRDLQTLSKKAIARAIAVVPQRCHVAFPVTVAEFVALGRYPHVGFLRGRTRQDQATVAACLAALRLDGLAERSVDQLSGGEFRRALVAQALAQEPSVLLLDEPVQQLDLRHQLEVMEFVRSFTRRPRMSGLVVLHELGLAARYCDRLVLLHEGRVSANGASADVLSTENLRAAFGIHAEVAVNATTGALQVVPIGVDDSR